MDNIDFIGDDPTLTTDPVPIMVHCVAQDTLLHNLLGGLQGGSLNERYHLTKAQWSSVIGGGGGGSSYTFSNGLTNTSGVVKLGGSLTATTTLDTANNTLIIGDLTNQKAIIGAVPATSQVELATKDSLNNTSIIRIASSDNSGSVANGISLLFTSSGGDYQAITINALVEALPAGFMYVGDRINNKGLENAGDYESNFSPRSLATKQYIDSGKIIGTIDDTAGVQTISELDTAFPGGLTGQHVISSTRVYEKNTSGWFYFTKTDCV